MRRTPGSPTIRIDAEVGATVFKAQLILSDQRPGRVTANEALKVLLAVNSLHRVGQGTPHPPEPDAVDPPCPRRDMTPTQRVCPRCDGQGEVPLPDPSGAATATCPTCHGTCRLTVRPPAPSPRPA